MPEETPEFDRRGDKDSDEFPSPKDKDKDEGIDVFNDDCKAIQIVLYSLQKQSNNNLH